MAMVGAAMVNRAPKLCFSYSSNHQLSLKPTKKKLMNSPKYIVIFQNLSSNTTLKLKGPSPPPLHASNTPTEEEEEETQSSTVTNDTRPISQEDWDYLWKLVAGSVACAAVIKYGSIFFPEITRPNIVQALIMVLTPVFVALVLLISQSRQPLK